MSDYEQTPYTGFPIAAAHPHRLAWTSFVHGGPRPAMERARVLEIGCGDGAHLLSIAAFEPGWTAQGIDGSARALATAAAGAAATGLNNVTFEQADIAAARVEPGAWDFVIAHGVYSWIDAERRAALRRLMRTALAPAGLAYLSFNAQPGWGVRGRVRDMLRRHPGLDPVELARRLIPLAAPDIWGQLIAYEIGRVANARPDYLAHEYLAEHNEAFWLGDVVAAAADDGFGWVGDAQFDLLEGRWITGARAALGLDGIAGHELADLLGYRQLHAIVLARADAPRHPAPDDDALLDAVGVAGQVLPVDDTFRAHVAEAGTMRSAQGLDIEVREPLGKTALLELASIYPDALEPAELERRARARLAAAGVEPGPDEPRLLREGLLRLWRAGALELRRHRLRVAVEPGAAPRPAPFTRYEAALRPALSTPLGTPIGVEPADLARLRELSDGDDALPGPLAATLARWGLLAPP